MRTTEYRLLFVVFSFTVTVTIWVPDPPLNGLTVHQSKFQSTIAVHAVLVLKVTVTAPPFDGNTGDFSVPLVNVIKSSSLACWYTIIISYAVPDSIIMFFVRPTVVEFFSNAIAIV